MKNVHTEHCCIQHGCKYGDNDCPVYSNRTQVIQSYPCESCNLSGIYSLEDLKKVLEGEVLACPHCGHIL